MGSSPLGRYAPLVASAVAVLLIAAYIVAAMTQNTYAVGILQTPTFGALVGLFGQALGVNGWKGPVAALHARLDAQGAGPAAGDSGVATP